MAVWAIGDVQGCYDELRRLLDALSFSPSDDRLWFVGDLVNRGPKSLDVLRFVRELGEAATTVLGNHDLHLLALARAAGPVPVADRYLVQVLEADDRDELLDWLIGRPLVHHDTALNTVLVHAGILPTWDVAETLAHAAEVEAALRGPDASDWFTAMYGARPERWSEKLRGFERLRFITNSLTRIRYVRDDGSLDMDANGPPGSQPDGLEPWFEVADRAAAGTRIVFGHWASAGYIDRNNTLGVDTGCVWGRKLTATRLDSEAKSVEVSSDQPRTV